MKTKNVVLFLAVVLVLFQGCIPSLYPLYTTDKLVMKKEIPGEWIDKEVGKSISLLDSGIISGTIRVKEEFLPVWKFIANKDKSYSLIFIDGNGQAGTFDAHLVQLEEYYFFNFYPRNPTEEEKKIYPELRESKFNELEELHYFPVNTFAKVNFKGNLMSISFFDGEFIEDLLEQNRIRIKHEKIDGAYILTAES
ncbi:MAG: hypothetical protein ACI8P3_003019, partial [Saprospiraceae bacterium]